MNRHPASAPLSPGLVSITFRALSPRAIVGAVAKAGLRGIEWGGDVHVPQGDLERAREVDRLTREAGLATAAYGSYYRLGESEAAGLSFAAVLDTAQTLKAPTIRVWAGKRASAQADGSYRRRVAEDACRVAGDAAAAGIAVAFEFHGGSLTDTLESTLALLDGTRHAGLRCYWQPPVGWPVASRMAALRALLPDLANLHVFHWGPQAERLPLADGQSEWLAYLRLAAGAPPMKPDVARWALLEFVRADALERFQEDAKTLLNCFAEPERYCQTDENE